MPFILFKVFLCVYAMLTLAQCRINVGPGERGVSSPRMYGSDEQWRQVGDHLSHRQQKQCDGFGWTLYKGKCYKVMEGLMDWNHMVAACRSESAILVCIQSEEENHFVGKLIEKPIERALENYHLETTLFNTFWIGLNRIKNGSEYVSTWVNGQRAKLGDLPEITTVTSTTNGNNKYPWGEGEPSGTNKFTDPTGTKEECVHMFSADGRWNDAECRVQMSGGVCQKLPK